MDIGMAKFTVRPMICEPVSSPLSHSIHRTSRLALQLRCHALENRWNFLTCASARQRCRLGSSSSGSRVRSQRKERPESKSAKLQRSEVVELLAVALKTLMEPENQKRLRARLCNPQPSIRAPLLPSEKNDDADETSVDLLSQRRRTEAPSIRAPLLPLEKNDDDLLSPSLSLSISAKFEAPPPARTEEIQSSDDDEDSSLSTMRRLKTLDVHSYVHKALRESFLRSHLRARQIEELDSRPVGRRHHLRPLMSSRPSIHKDRLNECPAAQNQSNDGRQEGSRLPESVSVSGSMQFEIQCEI
ncbi:hypothetical protein MPTK1_1g26310 [Marchantia polymorpha subsp. ruderalis]|uniref:Uncharacterized protein n=2 Tax=Marchantia polymorpha TaxID=3197 RepID=A0AAF6AUG8_MARPO|nr:hypothetical protein MARPO_0002s0247 [Marchantia polymorpha]BBN00089.1 hypothetical protein Mp_1g26310 [Marchantia polymorpha subsp. ruderalis]|eukprot:PTQ49796.1 hypothetical protein MARPO_0002s0247 [Marchantia polymorpha]